MSAHTRLNGYPAKRDVSVPLTVERLPAYKQPSALRLFGRGFIGGLKAFAMRWASAGQYARNLPRTRYNVAREVGDGTGSAVVMAPLLWLARTFPEAPLRVQYRATDGTLEPQHEHPMLELIDNPNAWYESVHLWMATIIDYNATGNAYWLKVRGPLNRVVELWYTPSWMIAPAFPRDGGEFLTHYEYRPDPGKQPIRLEPSEVVHFRFGIDPANTRKGLSPLASVLREVLTDDEAASMTTALLRNMGVPGVVITPGPDTDLLPEDGETIKAKYKQSFGADNRGDPLVLSTAGAKVEAFGFSPQQMDLARLRRIPEQRVSAVLGVSPLVTGLGAGDDTATFANKQAAYEAAYEANLIPTHRVFAATIKHQLLDDFDVVDRTRVVDFDTSTVRALQEDQTALVTRANAMLTSGGLLLNEWASMVGLQNADKRPRVYLRNAAIIEVPESGEPAAAPLALAAPKFAMREIAVKSSTARNRQLMHRLERELRGHERAFGAAVARKYARIAEQVAAAVAARVKGYQPEGRKADGDPDWPAWLLALADGGSVDDLLPADLGLSAEFRANYATIGEATFAAVSDALGLTVSWNLDDPRGQAILAAGATQAGLVNVDQQTRDAIYKALSEGRAAGDSIPQLIRRIKADVEGCSLYPGICEAKGPDAAAQYRSQVLARTESKTAQNRSSLEAYKASEVVSAVLVFDGDGCGWTSHLDEDMADGSTRSFEEAEQYPLAHPQCVRSFAPVVIGD